MNWTTSKPLIISHRGRTGGTPNVTENTLEALQAATKLAIHGLETDLRLTRDGRVVLFHDDDLQRLAGRSGTIEEKNWDEIKNIKLKGGEKIPSLEEALDLVKDKFLFNLEIKLRHSLQIGLEKAVAGVLKKLNLNDSILISSFHATALLRMWRHAPHLARGYLFGKYFAGHKALFPLTNSLSWNAPFSYASKETIQTAHAQGRRFFVWTVNTENDMKTCLENGADGIITDQPERLIKLLQTKS